MSEETNKERWVQMIDQLEKEDKIEKMAAAIYIRLVAKKINFEMTEQDSNFDFVMFERGARRAAAQFYEELRKDGRHESPRRTSR